MERPIHKIGDVILTKGKTGYYMVRIASAFYGQREGKKQWIYRVRPKAIGSVPEEDTETYNPLT